MTTNQINFYRAKQEARHWKRSDREQKRHNVSDESIRSESNAITDWFNQQTASHYVRQDAINDAHYQRMDAETQRHNRETEVIGLLNYDLDTKKLPIEQQKADAQTTTAEAKESDAAVRRYLALDPYGTETSKTVVNRATARHAAVDTDYLPMYYDLKRLETISKTGTGMVDTLSQAAKNIAPYVLPFIIY